MSPRPQPPGMPTPGSISDPIDQVQPRPSMPAPPTNPMLANTHFISGFDPSTIGQPSKPMTGGYDPVPQPGPVMPPMDKPMQADPMMGNGPPGGDAYPGMQGQRDAFNGLMGAQGPSGGNYAGGSNTFIEGGGNPAGRLRDFGQIAAEGASGNAMRQNPDGSFSSVGLGAGNPALGAGGAAPANNRAALARLLMQSRGRRGSRY